MELRGKLSQGNSYATDTKGFVYVRCSGGLFRSIEPSPDLDGEFPVAFLGAAGEITSIGPALSGPELSRLEWKEYKQE